MLTRSIVFSCLLVCSAASAALAETTTCTDAAGAISYLQSAYEGGVPPLPGTEVGSLTLVSQGQVLLHVITRAGVAGILAFPGDATLENEAPIGTLQDVDHNINIDIFTATLSAVDQNNQQTIAPTTVTCTHRHFRIPPP
jgi:hypothetical protein